jgi:hypothetical protein
MMAEAGSGMSIARSSYAWRIGTHLGHKTQIVPLDTTKKANFQDFPDAGGGTRTPDTRIMIPLL